MTIDLRFVWKLRLKLIAEGSKLSADGDGLWAEGNRLRAEGDKLWAEGILESYGNVAVEWKSDTHCIVNGTDEYKDE